jgi:hypothetical protein
MIPIRPATSAALRTLIGHVPLAVARAQPWSQDLADAYLTVLFDGLRPPR